MHNGTTNAHHYHGLRAETTKVDNTNPEEAIGNEM